MPQPPRKFLPRLSHSQPRSNDWCPFVDWSRAATRLPVSVDLRPQLSDIPIFDQGELGSCTANALCVAFAADVPRHKFTGSRLFLYYNERLMEGSTDEDAGAQISDGVLSLQKRGICPEEDWPYDPSQFKIAPPTECYDEAKRNRAATVHRIATNLQSMKTCLARGRPFVVGIEVFPALESDKVASTGLLPTPHPNEESIGGHAVLVVGYNDRHLHFIVRNSWGEDWGDAGHFYIPYAYLTNPTLSSDMWCIDAVFSADDQ